MINENGIVRYLTPEEIADMEAQDRAVEREHWLAVDYDEAVHARIRDRYSESQEFSILRQRDEKPEEYAAYYTYCEECKAFVKAKKAEYA